MKDNIFKKKLIIGVIFLFFFSIFIPITFGYNFRNTNFIESSIINCGNTLYVGGSGPNNYTKIQDAINDSIDGDMVFVYDDSSPYYEDNIQVSKSINLIGEDKNSTIIEGNGLENIVIITADNVIISGFTIQKSGGGIINVIKLTKAGIYNNGADNTIIYDNIIQDNRGEGIRIRSSQNCIVENNLIKGNCLRGLLIFDGSDNTIIKHNSIRNNSNSGILGKGLKNLNVIENNILFNRPEEPFGGIYGVELISTYNSNIKCNNFYYNRFDAGFSYFGYIDSMNSIFYFFEFLKEKKKGSSLKFDANYWNKGNIFPYVLDMGYITIEGPFTWVYQEYRYFKFDLHPAKKPYKIPGWDIASIP